MKKKEAFTLAEVLITLGIIGVVAAITIPGLINANKAHRLRAQFLKSYSTVQQVFKLMESDDVSLNPSDYSAVASFCQIFLKYLKGATYCGFTGQACYKNENVCYNYKTFDGKTVAQYSRFDDGQILLPDGTYMMFENPSGNYDGVWVSVDLNGYKNPPNRWGYDLFTFQFLDGELRTMGANETRYSNMSLYCTEKQTNSFNGVACAQKAKEDPDYFKKIIRKFK